MSERAQVYKVAVQNECALPRIRQQHSEGSHLNARIEPEGLLPVVCRNDQMLENRGIGRSLFIAVADQGGLRREPRRSGQRGKEHVFVLLSAVGRCENVLCLTRGEARCAEWQIDRRNSPRHKIINSFKLFFITLGPQRGFSCFCSYFSWHFKLSPHFFLGILVGAYLFERNRPRQ